MAKDVQVEKVPFAISIEVREPADSLATYLGDLTSALGLLISSKLGATVRVDSIEVNLSPKNRGLGRVSRRNFKRPPMLHRLLNSYFEIAPDASMTRVLAEKPRGDKAQMVAAAHSPPEQAKPGRRKKAAELLAKMAKQRAAAAARNRLATERQKKANERTGIIGNFGGKKVKGIGSGQYKGSEASAVPTARNKNQKNPVNQAPATSRSEPHGK